MPRSAWAGDDLPPGPIADEPDVRVLVVHHTVDANTYAPADVVGLLRRIHGFHTGPDRGWPDIAYNFIVDRFGRIWETRAGSLDRPVAGDASGGNQGFDQKCAFLGDHRTEAPTGDATAAMAGLLALLADRSGIDTRPGATTSFESRGSNLHPAGALVETATITGHRTLSSTACPGEAGFALVRDRLPAEVTARRRTPVASSTSTSSSAPPTTSPPSGGDTATTGATTAMISPTTAATEVAARPAADDGDPVPWTTVGAVGGLGAVVVGGAIALRNRRS